MTFHCCSNENKGTSGDNEEADLGQITPHVIQVWNSLPQYLVEVKILLLTEKTKGVNRRKTLQVLFKYNKCRTFVP